MKEKSKKITTTKGLKLTVQLTKDNIVSLEKYRKNRPSD